MGLGKTLQTIAFSAYLRECQNTRPFLVVCPLSVLHNWYDEYQKFAPTVSPPPALRVDHRLRCLLFTDTRLYIPRNPS